MGSELLIGVVSLLIGIALLWIAKPQRSGVPAKFLVSNPSLTIVYPVLPLLFLVIGVSMLIQALP